MHFKMLVKSKTFLVSLLLVAVSLFAVFPAMDSTYSGAAAYAGVVAAHPVQDWSLEAVPYHTVGNFTTSTGTYSGKVTVMVTFDVANASRLSLFLQNLSTSGSPQYHKYVSRSTFASVYSQSPSFYDQAAQYFSSYGLHVQTYPDRVSVLVSGNANAVSSAFHTKLGWFGRSGGGTYFAPTSQPDLPAWLAQKVNSMSGLSNRSVFTLPLGSARGASVPGTAQSLSVSGYPAPVPVTYSSYSATLVWGSDMQVAYDEQTLFNYTYPTKEVIATILWPGYNTTQNKDVAPFYPADIYAYFNASLPLWEPHAKVYGVPVPGSGAPMPGSSAQNDSTGAAAENTLDLEMAGSTAPGASIYNVYGTNATFSQLDSAFAYILNPTNTPGLDNVSVISNSWGSKDTNVTPWTTYLQEAQARGITVLASSGDSGDNTASSKYDTGGPAGDFTEFPSSMAYNDFGVTAVGGTTVTLNSNLHAASQVVWNISSTDTAEGGPAGTTGGYSSVFAEPTWQKSSEANNVIGGAGRGTPDISALANETMTYITFKGTHYYYSTNGYWWFNWGTSVASPLVAGIIAEINAVMKLHGKNNTGYLNPALYQLGDMQYRDKQVNTSTTAGYSDSPPIYPYTIPLLPFSDVTVGKNDVYSALPGWDYPTGWGSIDATNLTAYLLVDNHSQYYYALDGVENVFNVSALKVTSPGKTFNASIQQNFFVADSLGTPLYWIQNVIYINGSNAAGWAVNYSGWSVYPFWGVYPALTYQYDFPPGKIITFPHHFDIKTWLSNTSVLNGQTINFQINSQILHMQAPGAAYIIGALNYSYYYEGVLYYNGPFPDNPIPGGLSPQFGIVGGPSGGNGSFQSPTNATMQTYVKHMGSTSYWIPYSKAYGSSVDQTGETATNLTWIRNGTGWNLSTSPGSYEQGVLSYLTPTGAYFNETGLPSGTVWYVNVTGGETSGPFSGKSYLFILPPGTYNYTIATQDKRYEAAGGNVTVINNVTVPVSVNFTLITYTVTFTESGLPSNASWWVNITGGFHSKVTLAGTSIVANLSNGTWTYTANSTDKHYSSPGGQFYVNGSVHTVGVNFSISSVNNSSLPPLDVLIIVLILAIILIAAGVVVTRKKT